MLSIFLLLHIIYRLHSYERLRVIIYKKHYVKALFFCLVLFSGIVSCQQNQDQPFGEEKVTETEEKRLPVITEADRHVAELLDEMKMYRFDAVQPAPAFHLTSVTGETVHLEQYRGKVVLLNFWATW